MARTMLSTMDNPYDPFKQYDLWSGYDEKVGGYFSSSLLARFAPVSIEETKADAERITERAIDTIVEMDLPIFNPITGERTQYIKVEEHQ